MDDRDRRRPAGTGAVRRVPPPRPPARVFWIRRLVVLGLPLVAIVLLVTWLLDRGGDDPTPAAAVDPPAATPTPSPTTEDAAGGVATCDPASLALTVAPGGEAFAADVDPTFEVTVTNSGAAPCLVDAGDAHQEVVITSGEDRVWSSLDCAGDDAATRTLLLPAGESDVSALTWTRVRSAEGCPGGLPSPQPGTYSVTVALQGATSPAAVFGLG
ncbi:hypothetical protein [Cellulomonas iranensis]|uniref:DUF4232 domain-containing protein n=1 Tax=Cellulomonas iranensis TaxID=76862 RepID=A0ABU0GHJ7_9CELL|nr:hypothetical protein [Cellulomonas iranensis]MDQ0424833.1 hypothetical protein [Cellulomonas iranensis]